MERLYVRSREETRLREIWNERLMDLPKRREGTGDDLRRGAQRPEGCRVRPSPQEVGRDAHRERPRLRHHQDGVGHPRGRRTFGRTIPGAGRLRRRYRLQGQLPLPREGP